MLRKSSHSRLLQDPFAHSWSMRSGRAKVQPTWCETTRLTVKGGLGGGGPAYRAWRRFFALGAGGEKCERYCKNWAQGRWAKNAILSEEGPPPLQKMTQFRGGVCSHSRADSSRCGHSPDISVAHNNEAGVCQGGGGRGAHQPNPRTHQQLQM